MKQFYGWAGFCLMTLVLPGCGGGGGPDVDLKMSDDEVYGSEVKMLVQDIQGAEEPDLAIEDALENLAGEEGGMAVPSSLQDKHDQIVAKLKELQASPSDSAKLQELVQLAEGLPGEAPADDAGGGEEGDL